MLTALVIVFLYSTKSVTPKNVSFTTVKLRSVNPAPLLQQKIENNVQQKISLNKSLEGKLITEEVLPQHTSEVNPSIGESDLELSLQGNAPTTKEAQYLAEVRTKIASHQKYPAPSRAFREEGVVKIRLTINRSGSVLKIELIEECPHKRLNDAAMTAVTRAAPFQSFPEGIDFEIWKITLPVRFVLSHG